MLQTNDNQLNRVKQGDIISDVEFIESAEEVEGVISVSKIIFPLVIVLTQDCDLNSDYESRAKDDPTHQDGRLFSAIVAPLYNYEHFIAGEHLSDLGQKMRTISSNKEKTDNKNLRRNETDRYHYLEFDTTIPIVNSIIDFKHYFCVNIQKLQEHKKDHYVCSISALFRERISQRYANYLSRIGLPENKKKEENL